MLRQGKGAIVNTSSIFGLVGIEEVSGYVMSKHARAGLTHATALEYARRGVRINAVCPEVIQTP
jgi:NAD(P)-dependent dehydrogenase (short-subunit alcohol dehydrogenase family)